MGKVRLEKRGIHEASTLFAGAVGQAGYGAKTRVQATSKVVAEVNGLQEGLAPEVGDGAATIDDADDEGAGTGGAGLRRGSGRVARGRRSSREDEADQCTVRAASGQCRRPFWRLAGRRRRRGIVGMGARAGSRPAKAHGATGMSRRRRRCCQCHLSLPEMSGLRGPGVWAMNSALGSWPFQAWNIGGV